MNNIINNEEYDTNNIFAKIIRKEIPAKIIYENDNVLCFEDINPRAPVHILIIPKGKYKNIGDFSSSAKDIEVLSLTRAISKIVKDYNLSNEGYRVITNTGEHGRQEVEHFHFHLIAGKDTGKMLNI